MLVLVTLGCQTTHADKLCCGVAGSWVVVVTWDEPEAGVCVMGPYKTHLEARFACTENDDWLEQFAVPGEEDDDPMIVTDDVTFTVALCGEPYLI